MKLSQFYTPVQIPTATEDTLGVVKPGVSMAVTAEGALNVTVDDALSDSSENPVQNKAVKTELDSKLTTPSGGTSGQVLSKTSFGYAWVNQSGGSSSGSGSSITSVMFKIPTIESDDDIYHIKVEFCADDTFETITHTFNSSTSQTAFRVFTGLAGANFPSAGLGTQFSNEQVILDATGVTSNYYRFQWLAGTYGSSDYVAGRFGYGQLNAIQSVFDGTVTSSGSGGGNVPGQEMAITWGVLASVTDASSFTGTAQALKSDGTLGLPGTVTYDFTKPEA